MRGSRTLAICAGLFLCLALRHPSVTAAQSLNERNEALLKKLQEVHGLSGQQMDRLRTIFRESGFIGQGNPSVTEHPVTEER